MRASTTGSLGTAKGNLSIITQLNCSPGTSTPCQKLDVANSTQFGVVRNSSSKRAPRPRPLHQRFPRDFQRHAVVNQPHLLIAGEQHERASAAEVQNLDNLPRRRRRERRISRIGQILRHVQQRLLLIIEMARHDQRSRTPQAQPRLRKFEIPGDRQRGRRQHHRVDPIEQPFIEQLRNVNRRGLQKCSTTAPLDPVDEACDLSPSIQNSSRRAMSRARFTSGMVSSGPNRSNSSCSETSSSACRTS